MSRRYAARAAVVAEAGPHGRTRLSELRSDGPLALRQTPDAVYLVGAAAGPLGGDELTLEVVVGPGARLAIRSVASTLVLPGEGESRFTVRARVGAGGHLDFAPEPTVAAAGSRHRATASIDLAEGGALRWREELILGRHGERPGRHTGRLDVTYGGRPLLRHELDLTDPAVRTSGAVLGGAGAVGSVLLAGPGLTASGRDSAAHAAEGLAVLPLAGPGVLVTALGAGSAQLRRRLEEGEALALGRARPGTGAARIA